MKPQTSRASVLLVFADPVLWPPAFPYGRDTVAEAVAAHGIAVQVLHPYLCGLPLEAVREACDRLQPTVVGLSFRNLDYAGFSFRESGESTFTLELKALAAAARTPGRILAVGGSGFSIAPVTILDQIEGDVGFVGTSEMAFGEFCRRYVIDGMPLREAVRGLEGAFSRGDPASRPARTHLGRIARLDPLAIEYARLVGGTVPIRTKSGCSLKCTYCVVPWIEALNERPWSDIREEIRRAVEAGIGDRLFIADGELNLPSAARAIDLCHRMRQEFEGRIAWRCYVEAGFVTKELVRVMADAGCVSVSLTVDSYSAEPRRGFAKRTPPENAILGTQLFLDAGIRTTINLLFGGPLESLASAADTAVVASGFHGQGADLSVTVGLRVYPQTPLAKQCKHPNYRCYFEPCEEHAWLGVFCSPLPRHELGELIVRMLPSDGRVHFTKAVGQAEAAFYGRMGQGADLLTHEDFVGAEVLFQALGAEYPHRKEVQLGLLKARAGLLSRGQACHGTQGRTSHPCRVSRGGAYGSAVAPRTAAGS